MSKHRFRIGLLFLFLLFTLISTHIAFADGPIRYLPFKGSVYLTCGYHVNCGNPFIAGEGTDWAISGWSQGVVTYATGQGTVSSINPVGSFGNQVLIDHISDYWSRHAHLWYWFPAEGHVLAPGMPVGYMGKTGCGSCNPHLHWHAYNQSSAPGELSYGVDPAPIPLPLTPLPPPAPTAIPTDGFTLSQGSSPRLYANNTNYDSMVYGCDENYSCFTLSGSATGSCEWIRGDDNRWASENRWPGYFWQGGIDPARVYQISCPTVSSSFSPTVIARWRPSTPNNTPLPAGYYRIYAIAPDNPTTLTYASMMYRVYRNGQLMTFKVWNQELSANDLVYLGRVYASAQTNDIYVEVQNNSGGSNIRVGLDSVFWSKD